MKKIIVCSYLILHCLAACKKDGDAVSGPDDNGPMYLLTRRLATAPYNGSEDLFYYNEDNSLNTVEHRSWGTYETGNSGPQIWRDTSFAYFEYLNRQTVKMSQGPFFSYQIYECDESGKPLTMTNYSTQYIGEDSATAVPVYDVPQAYRLFKYDSRGNLIERRDSTNKLNYLTEFTYDDSSNLKSALTYSFTSPPTGKWKVEYSRHEKQAGKVKQLYILPPNVADAPLASNPQTEKYYSVVNIDEPFGEPHPTHTTYEYDAEGLLVKEYSGPWVVSYEYKKTR